MNLQGRTLLLSVLPLIGIEMYEIIPKLFKDHSHYPYFTCDDFLKRTLYNLLLIKWTVSNSVYHKGTFKSILIHFGFSVQSFHFSIENGNGQNVKYVRVK